MIGTATEASVVLHPAGSEGPLTDYSLKPTFTDLEITEVENHGLTGTVRLYSNLNDETECLLSDSLAWDGGHTGALKAGMYIEVSDSDGTVGMFLITTLTADDDVVDLEFGDFVQVLRATGYDYVMNLYAAGAWTEDDMTPIWDDNADELQIPIPKGVTVYGNGGTDDYYDIYWYANAEEDYMPSSEPSNGTTAKVGETVEVSISTSLDFAYKLTLNYIGDSETGGMLKAYAYSGNGSLIGSYSGTTAWSEEWSIDLSDGNGPADVSEGITLKLTQTSGTSLIVSYRSTSSASLCRTLYGMTGTFNVVGEQDGDVFIVSSVGGETADEEMLAPYDGDTYDLWTGRAVIYYIDPGTYVLSSDDFATVAEAGGGTVSGVTSMREVNVFRCNLAEYHDYMLALADMAEPSMDDLGLEEYNTEDSALTSLTVTTGSFASYLGKVVHVVAGTSCLFYFDPDSYSVTEASGMEERTSSSYHWVRTGTTVPGVYWARFEDSAGDDAGYIVVEAHALSELTASASDILSTTMYIAVGSEVSISGDSVYAVQSATDGFGLTVSDYSLTGTLTATGEVEVEVEVSENNRRYTTVLYSVDPSAYVEDPFDRRLAFCADPDSWNGLALGYRHLASDDTAIELRYGGDAGDHSIPVVSFAPSMTLKNRPRCAVCAGTREDGTPILISVPDPSVPVGCQSLVADSSSTTDVEAALAAYAEVMDSVSGEWEGSIVLSGIRRGFFTRSGQAIGGVPVRLYDSRYGMDGYEARVREAVYDYASQKTTLTLNNYSEAYSNSILDSSKMAYKAGSMALEATSSDLYVRSFAYAEASSSKCPSSVTAMYAYAYSTTSGSYARYKADSVTDVTLPELGVRIITGYWPAGTSSETDARCVRYLSNLAYSVSSDNFTSGTYAVGIDETRWCDFYSTNSLVGEIVYKLRRDSRAWSSERRRCSRSSRSRSSSWLRGRPSP